MIRPIVAAIAAIALTGTAFAQQQEVQQAEQEVRQFMEEFSQRLAEDPEAYLDHLSFPVQISTRTADGEIVTASFEEEHFRLLGYLPTEEIRFHVTQQAVMQQLRGAVGQLEPGEEGLEEDGEVVEEELTVMPREQIIEQARIRPVTTDIQFVGENVAFVRTTLAIGEEAVGAGRAEADVAGLEEENGIEEENGEVVEEELAVQPGPGQAHLELGALLVREEGEWRVKSLIAGQAHTQE
jgi:hypothetical protein